MTNILFFPESMPDEMLLSRITRYHVLSGNKKESETFHELFGSIPFSLSIIPKQLDILASRLPGDKEENLVQLLMENTSFPSYKPFIGLSKDLRGEEAIASVARMPRRENSAHNRAKICPSCAQADLVESGYSYWHRAHQMPGVTACWRHGEVLLQSCPTCSHPFFRKLKLLPDIGEGCTCGWSALAPTSYLPASDIEREYAIFAKDILHRDLPYTDFKILSDCYRRQAIEKGFNNGSLLGSAKLVASIKAAYGDELLSRMDKAYGNGLRSQWIRISSSRGQIDMPLVRHLIICQQLFVDVETFERRLLEESIIAGERRKSRSAVRDESPKSKRAECRSKVRILAAARPNMDMEYLWTNAYQVTRWLNENDKEWLLATLDRKVAVREKSKPKTRANDQMYADLVSDGVRNLYQVTQGQKRVNVTNMLMLLPRKIERCPLMRKELYPILSQQIELHAESVWHFRLRRIVWAMSEISRLNLPMNNSNKRLFTSVPDKAWIAMQHHFDWDVDALMRTRLSPEELLKSTGVSHQWEGPPGCDEPLGGNAYMELARRSTT